jgi:hypothetical protein
MAAVAAGAAVVGAAVSAYSAIKQGQSAQAAGNYNAQVAQNNAISATQQGSAAEAQSRLQSRAQIGLEQANFGASGVDMSSGSPLDVLRGSAAQGELDAQQTKYSYQMKALGYSTDATLSSFEGNNAANSGYLGAAGRLLAGGASAYGLYNKGGVKPSTTDTEGT